VGRLSLVGSSGELVDLISRRGFATFGKSLLSVRAFHMGENTTDELRQWWRALDITWQRIFKLALDINHTPTDAELQDIVELRAVDCSNKRIISLKPLQRLKDLQQCIGWVYRLGAFARCPHCSTGARYAEWLIPVSC